MATSDYTQPKDVPEPAHFVTSNRLFFTRTTPARDASLATIR